MTLSSSRLSFTASELVTRGMDGIRFEAAELGGLIRAETTVERMRRLHLPLDDEWGRSCSLDPDNVGDIADEGAGHRG